MFIGLDPMEKHRWDCDYWVGPNRQPQLVFGIGSFMLVIGLDPIIVYMKGLGLGLSLRY